uniref:Uncharacterized protein n=1 Tax=Geoglobus ahangari TaxID=113653 RepID=A0A7C4WCA5_9EURY
MEIEIDCPICNDRKKHVAEVLKVFEGKFRRRSAEFDAIIMIVKCKDCKTIGIYRRVDSINMENYEFPYEGEI